MKKKIIIGAVAIFAAIAAVVGWYKIRAARKKYKKMPGNIPVR